MTIAEILQVEKHAEDGFLQWLKEVLPPAFERNIFVSRTTRIAETPSVEIKVINGQVLPNHEHVFQNPVNTMYDTFQAEMRTTVITNRQTDSEAPSHVELLGRLRAKMQRITLVNNYVNPVVLIIDSREQGTVDSEDSENTLDISTVSWFIVLQINPSVWPLNP